MSSDTDSSNSISSEDNRKRSKSGKKHKSKSEKKHNKKHKKEKRHKQSKRSRQDAESPKFVKVDKIALTPVRSAETASEEVDDAFGPALPPHLMQTHEKPPLPIIGPVMPTDFANRTANEEPKNDILESKTKSTEGKEIGDDDEVLCYGPMPVTAGENVQLTDTQIELEQRALQLKLAALEGTNSQSVDQKVREEWMLELPEVGLKTGLAALSNLKRTFHQGKERPDFSDRTSWTKTPQGDDAAAASSSKSTAVSMQNNAKALYERQRDEEQERIAKKHKKKHKRDESLVEIHQKKLRKEEKRKLKELAALGAKPDRRPFSRDVDMKLNKIDKNQTKQIVDKAKILNTKFSSGHTKYL